MTEAARTGERIFRGIPASTGIGRARVRILGQTAGAVPVRAISEADVPGELLRLEQALVKTRQQILEVQRRVEEAMGRQDASIFDAHLLVLEDRLLLDEVTRIISADRINVEAAFQRVADKYAATLAAIEDEYLRERASDIRDVTARVLNNLQHRSTDTDLAHLTEPCILVAPDIPPSMAATLDRRKVVGVATDAGSKTSHTAIMARALQIPAIVGLHDISARLSADDYVLVDGYNGLLIINPTDQTLFEYGQLIRKQVNLADKLRDVQDKPAVTLDGVRIGIRANIEQTTDTTEAREVGAEGVGLFRTEYLFINREAPPSEEEQFEAYRQTAEAMKPSPVIIRTLDLGGDKMLSPAQVPQEMNPFMGWRAIRFCLVEHAIFREQMRAILRASAHGTVKIMYPMISGLQEVVQANRMLDEVKAELRREGRPFDEGIEVGVMIEVPSAVLIAESLARQVRFFSIGTNDLIQYSLAVDRLNERIAHLYEPTHPAIVTLIHMTAEAGRRHGIPVSVCGEMAGDPALVPLLLGLGVTELSASPPAIPALKFLIRRLKMSEARDLAAFALGCESGAAILERTRTLAREIAPSLFEAETAPPATGAS